MNKCNLQHVFYFNGLDEMKNGKGFTAYVKFKHI